MANGVAASAYMFDTHGFVKRLIAAGLPEAAAETFADEQSRLVEQVTSSVASVASNAASKDELKEYKSALKEYKSDMKEDFKRLDVSLGRLEVSLEAKMDTKFEILRKETDAKLSANTVSIVKWMAGLMLTQVGLVFTILKLFVL